MRPDMARRPPGRPDDRQSQHVPTSPSPERQASVSRLADRSDSATEVAMVGSCQGCRDLYLALSDERDRGIVREITGERRGFRRGWADGFAAGELAGRAAEIAEQTAAWRVAAGIVLAAADQSGPEARAAVHRRLAAAMAGERRDAAAHWRAWWTRTLALVVDTSYLRAARAIPVERRSHEQNVMLALAAERSSLLRRGAA